MTCIPTLRGRQSWAAIGILQIRQEDGLLRWPVTAHSRNCGSETADRGKGRWSQLLFYCCKLGGEREKLSYLCFGLLSLFLKFMHKDHMKGLGGMLYPEPRFQAVRKQAFLYSQSSA